MKYVYDKLEDIPAEFRNAYEKRDADGKFHLKIEGDAPEVETLRGQLTSFRENNTGLNKKLAEATDRLKQFDGVDPSEYAKLKEEVEAFRKKTGASAPDQVDVDQRIREEVAKAVAAVQTPLQKQVEQLAAEKKAADDRLARRDLEAILRDLGAKGGVTETAMTDFLARGHNAFVLEDGRAVRKDNKGETVYGKKDPTKPAPPEEWLDEQYREAPHLFKPSKGSGAEGRAPGGRTRTVSNDPVEVGRNLEEIAKGNVHVAPAQ